MPSIDVQLSLSSSISEIGPIGSTTRLAWESAFILDLATILGIEPARISIVYIYAASVIILLRIVDASSANERSASEAVQWLQTREAGSLQIGSNTVEAVSTIQNAPPTLPLADTSSTALTSGAAGGGESNKVSVGSLLAAGTPANCIPPAVASLASHSFYVSAVAGGVFFMSVVVCLVAWVLVQRIRAAKLQLADVVSSNEIGRPDVATSQMRAVSHRHSGSQAPFSPPLSHHVTDSSIASKPCTGIYCTSNTSQARRG